MDYDQNLNKYCAQLTKADWYKSHLGLKPNCVGVSKLSSRNKKTLLKMILSKIFPQIGKRLGDNY